MGGGERHGNGWMNTGRLNIKVSCDSVDFRNSIVAAHSQESTGVHENFIRRKPVQDLESHSPDAALFLISQSTISGEIDDVLVQRSNESTDGRGRLDLP